MYISKEGTMDTINTFGEMDLYKVADRYVEEMLGKDNDTSKKSSIRVLLLDRHTSSIISLVSTQSDLLQKEVYLVDKLENNERDKLRNLECICFLKPDDVTITNLSQEIGNPKYSNYQIYFNNVASKSRLERLAESDDLEIVDKVVEVFQDYYVLNKSLFTITSIGSPYMINNTSLWDPNTLESSIEGLISLLLSLNMKPIIRYESNSRVASKLANAINYEITSGKDVIFNQLKSNKDVPPLLLILDRKNDPITPLLFPWTYQSMINEVMGINNVRNSVDLSHLSNISEELRTVLMNQTQDLFYEKTMFMNFGDLSSYLKQYVDEYKSKTKTNSNISSIKDMKYFLENYPEYKKMSLNLSKHMLISSEIDKQINDLRVWETSEFEQNLCSNSDTAHHDEDLKELETLLFDMGDGKNKKIISDEIKMKLLGLYALKYESFHANQTNTLLKRLNNIKFDNFVKAIIKYGGLKSRMKNSENNEGNIFNKIGSSNVNSGGAANHVVQLFNNFSGSSNEDANAYMQFEPRIKILLDKIKQGKLSDVNFPTIGENSNNPKNVVREVIVFMIGGVSYEEARIVNEFNLKNDGFRVVIGGTQTINSKQFMEEISEVCSGN